MPDMPKGTERPEVNQTTGAIDQTSEQHPFTAAERISKALRKRKQRNQIRRMAGKYLGTAIMVTALILAVVVVYRNWDFFKPESFKETVTIRSDSKSLMKIGGAMDVITGNTAQYMSFASGLAVVTTTNIRYATEAGDAGFLADLMLNQPAAAASGSHLVVYDRGGKTVASADESGILAKAEALGNCISADVNRNGWIAIVSECEGYQCAAAVYDQQMNRRYVWKTPAYFAAGAIASENGNYMAVLTVSIEERQLSAKVLVFHLQKEGVAAEIDFRGCPRLGRDGKRRRFADCDGYRGHYRILERRRHGACELSGRSGLRHGKRWPCDFPAADSRKRCDGSVSPDQTGRNGDADRPHSPEV